MPEKEETKKPPAEIQEEVASQILTGESLH